MNINEAESMISMGSSINADAWNTLTDCMNYGSAMETAAVNILKLLYKRVQKKERIELKLKKGSNDYSKIIDLNSFDAIVIQYFSPSILERVKED